MFFVFFFSLRCTQHDNLDNYKLPRLDSCSRKLDSHRINRMILHRLYSTCVLFLLCSFLLTINVSCGCIAAIVKLTYPTPTYIPPLGRSFLRCFPASQVCTINGRSLIRSDSPLMLSHLGNFYPTKLSLPPLLL